MVILRRKLAYWAACAGVIVLPVVMTLLMVRFHLDAELTDGIPIYYGIYNDSFYYWRQIATFKEAGFAGGYYTIYEDPAAAQFSRFYVHGPLFPMLYGSITVLTGWDYGTGPVINFLLVTGALAFLIYMLRPGWQQLLLLGVALATFWPLLLYLPALMQESLHFSFAIILAALFYRLMQQNGPIPRWAVAGFVLVLIAFSLVRVLWAFMFVPFFLLLNRRRTLAGYGVALLMAAGMIVIMFLIANTIMAPYSLSYTQDLMRDFRSSIPAGLTSLWNHIRLNVDNFQSGDPLAVAQRCQIVLLIVMAAGIGLLLWWRKEQPPEAQAETTDIRPWIWQEIILHLFALIMPIVFTITLYDFFDWHDYRVLAPPLFVSVLLFVAFKRRIVLAIFVGTNLLVLPAFFTAYAHLWSDQFTYDRQRIEDFGALTRELLVFDPATENGWCNTLYLQVTKRGERFAAFPPELLAVDHRMGISFFINPTLVKQPIRSKYFLMDTWTIDAIPGGTRTELLGYTPVGNLYRNLDAEC